jgi:hypothetical protein
LWEIPVSCVPYLRLPFYANFNLLTGNRLFQLSSALARGKHCNYVFHAVEMLDMNELDPRIHRHPNARLPLSDKISRCRNFLHHLMQGRRVLLSREFAVELSNSRVSLPCVGQPSASGNAHDDPTSSGQRKGHD